MGIENNTVSAQKQVQKQHYTEIFNNGGKVNVLFLGNSITRHEPKPEIGWEHDWGMAASKRENDYVHVAVRLLEEKIGKINYCIANCGEWELNYFNDEIIKEWEIAKNFQADIIVVRLGENILQAKDKFLTHSITPHYLKMVEYFSVKPNAKVVATGLFWKNGEVESSIEQAAKEKGYLFVKLDDLGEDKGNMAIGQFWHGGVAIHPNDEGMRKIAERIVAVL